MKIMVIILIWKMPERFWTERKTIFETHYLTDENKKTGPQAAG
jgi:hypothetical protein